MALEKGCIVRDERRQTRSRANVRVKLPDDLMQDCVAVTAASTASQTLAIDDRSPRIKLLRGQVQLGPAAALETDDEAAECESEHIVKPGHSRVLQVSERVAELVRAALRR